MRDEVIKALVQTGKWSEENAKLSERAGHRCEYCGMDFLASPDNYKQWQRDHIIPTSKGGSDNFDNLALACWTCNFAYKSDWDPRSATSSSNRDDLIKAVRRYVTDRRTRTFEEVLACRTIIAS